MTQIRLNVFTLLFIVFRQSLIKGSTLANITNLRYFSPSSFLAFYFGNQPFDFNSINILKQTVPLVKLLSKTNLSPNL